MSIPNVNNENDSFFKQRKSGTIQKKDYNSPTEFIGSILVFGGRGGGGLVFQKAYSYHLLYSKKAHFIVEILDETQTNGKIAVH